MKHTLIRSRFDAAKEALSKQPMVDASRIGAAGYCFGGSVVLDGVRAGSDLKGVVVLYSLLIPSAAQAQAGRVKSKVQFTAKRAPAAHTAHASRSEINIIGIVRDFGQIQAPDFGPRQAVPTSRPN